MTAPAVETREVSVSARAAGPSDHLPALTGLRFVLAIWVMLHHITGSGMMLEGWAQSLPSALYTIIRGGYLAVGTFFVLSGFVLGRRYAGSTWDRKSLGRYAVSRVARVYPVYALSLAVVLPFIIWEFRAAWVGNYILLLQGWMENIPVHWNTPAWSLSCEVFFYLCFPLAIFIFRPRSWPGILVLTALACVLTANLRSNGLPEHMKPLMHFSDFLMGIAAAGVYGRLENSGFRFRGLGVCLYLPAIVFALALIARPDWLRHYSTLNGMLRPLNAIALIGFAAGGGFLARLLATNSAMFLGKASYSMYILHVPLLWWWKFIAPVNPLPQTISGIVYTILVIVASGYVFHRFEEPWNGRVRAYLQKRLAL